MAHTAWVLPVPGSPKARTLTPLSTKLPSASSSSCCLSATGTLSCSKVSHVLPTGSLDARLMRMMRLCRRSSASCSNTTLQRPQLRHTEPAGMPLVELLQNSRRLQRSLNVAPQEALDPTPRRTGPVGFATSACPSSPTAACLAATSAPSARSCQMPLPPLVDSCLPLASASVALPADL